MRLVILCSTLCYRCCRATAYTAQSQSCASAPKPSTIDIIKQPLLLRQKLAGNCTTTCQWIRRPAVCNTYCF